MMRQHGFTLLELIVVIGIFAVMSAMAYGGLNSVLTTRVRIEEALARTAEYQKAWQRLRSDFQQLQPRPIRDGFGAVQPPLKGDRFGNVEFTRGGWRNPLNSPRTTFERAAYRLEDKKLMRDSWRALDRAQDSLPVQTVLLDRVTEIAWRFQGANREWTDQWPSAQASQTTAPAPIAVELVLQTEDWGELRFLFRTGIEALPP